MLPLCHNYFSITPSNKPNQDVGHQSDKKKYAFGVFILLLVVVLWISSSEVTKYIYAEKHLERPFLVTYIRSSLLFIYLLVLCFTPPTRDPCRPADYTQLLEPTPETDDESYFMESTNSLGDSTFVPVRAGEATDSDDAAPRAVRFNKVAEVRVMSAAMAGEALLARLSWAASVRATEHAQRRAAAAATRRHLRLAAFFCLPWFISNYLYRLSILHTSTSSATIYTSTTGAIALSLGAVFAQSPNDRFTVSKSVAVLFTAAGLVTLGISESHQSNWIAMLSALGSALCYSVHLVLLIETVTLGISESHQSNWIAMLSALGSALCYSVHLVLFRHEMRKGDGINSPLLVGLVGCACGCVAWAMGGVLSAVGVEAAEVPTPKLWSYLLLDAVLGPILMDSLWLWGVSLTSAQTATSMLGLAAPLAACVDAYRNGGDVWHAISAALCGLGFTAAVMNVTVQLPLTFITNKMRAAEGFTVIRNIPDLDEQTEALMSSDEPT